MTLRAGWYDDPEAPGHLRYWDGVVWTAHRVPKASPTADQSTIGRAYEVPTLPARATAYPPAQPPGMPGQQPGGSGPYSQPPTQGGYAQPPAGVWALSGPTTPDGTPLASWSTRLGAYLIDGVITGLIAGILSSYWLYQFVQWYIGFLNEAVRSGQQSRQLSIDQAAIQGEVSRYLLPVVLIGIVVYVGYHTYFLTRTGATPGKMLLRMTVRRRDRPGPLTVRDALKRQVIAVGANLLGIVPILGTLVSVLPLLDGLWPLWDDKRQALHDKIAGTNVVIAPKDRR